MGRLNSSIKESELVWKFSTWFLLQQAIKYLIEVDITMT